MYELFRLEGKANPNLCYNKVCYKENALYMPYKENTLYMPYKENALCLTAL